MERHQIRRLHENRVEGNRWQTCLTHGATQPRAHAKHLNLVEQRINEASDHVHEDRVIVAHTSEQLLPCFGDVCLIACEVRRVAEDLKSKLVLMEVKELSNKFVDTGPGVRANTVRNG